MNCQLADAASGKGDRPLVRPAAAAAHDQAGEGALAGTVGADQGVHFAGGDGQREPVDDPPTPGAVVQVADLEQRHTEAFVRCRSPAAHLTRKD